MYIFKKINESNRIKQFKIDLIEQFFFINDLIYLLFFYFKKAPEKINIITAADKNFFDPLLELLKSTHNYPFVAQTVVYDLGLDKNQSSELLNQFPHIVLKKFDFSKNPSFVSKRDEFNKLGSYSWKSSIILSEIKKSSNLILWMDSANLIGPKNRNVIKIIYEKGFYSPYSKGTINDWTHELTLQELKVSEHLQTKRNLTGGLIGINPNNKKIVSFIEAWNKACLNENIISPLGSNRQNHRQDQSLLSIFFYKMLNKKYYFKTKKITSIKVNQNLKQIFYIIDNQKYNDFKLSWIQKYSDITTNTVFKAKYVFLFSEKDIHKIPKKVLKNIKRLFVYIDEKNLTTLNKQLKNVDCTYIVKSNLLLKDVEEDTNLIYLNKDLENSIEFLRKLLKDYL
tara:strand:+ start:261 stop:1451 length:1191 start_codon:yes stop_codon:yes gene_type:complete